MTDPDLDLVRRVAPAVQAKVRRTPLYPSAWLSQLHGGDVFLKCENLQVTGSFKVRGALARLSEPDAKKRGVVAASAGNHALGVAFAAKELGVRCTLYVPRTIPAVKRDKIRALGAELILAPHDNYDATQEYALERVGDRIWVSPFDDPWVMAGNGGTTMLEIVEEMPGIDAIVAPCGGGGLIIGLGIVARERCAGALVLGVNSEASPGMWLSRRNGVAHLQIMSKPTIAEGIEGGIAESTFRLGKRYIDDVAVVTEAAIERAVAEIHWRHGMDIEGSAAAAVAAFLEGLVPKERRRVVVVLTGANIDPARSKAILEKYPDSRDLSVLWREQQHARFPTSCTKQALEGLPLAKLDAATAFVLTSCLRTDGQVRPLTPERRQELRKCEDRLMRVLDEVRMDEEGFAYFDRLRRIAAEVMKQT